MLAGTANGQHKVALVLSGGGAQGMAHIGVFKAFEEYQIPIDLIVGSSAGALVGGLYAAGVTVEAMETMVRDGTIEHLFTGRSKRSDLPIWKRDEPYLGNLSLGISNRQIVGSPGLLDDRLIWKELFLLTAAADFQAGWNFDSLYVPFRAVASDLRKQAPHIFSSGPLANALRPSMSIPLIYSPIQQNGQVLVDGGVYVKLPVEVALAEAPDFVIAVSAEDAPEAGDEIQGLGAMFEEINTRILASGDSADVRGWDYFFRIPTAGHHVLDFPAGEDLMAAGYRAGVEAAETLVKIFEERGYQRRIIATREPYDKALDGKLLKLTLKSEQAGFAPDMIRQKLKLPDSLRFNRKQLDDLIDDVYAADIYQAVIPSLSRDGTTIVLTLREKPDIRTRGRLEISSSRGLTLFTRTDSPRSRFGGLVQLDAAFGNVSGGACLAVYPVSYHKTGARLPFSIRPALGIKTDYHNYNLPGTLPLATRMLSHEISMHSASIGGWNRQMLVYGGLRHDDPGDIQAVVQDFAFETVTASTHPFARVVYQEDHITRDQPVVEGWKFGVQSDWVWQNSLPVNRTQLWGTLGGKLIYGWSGVLSVTYENGSQNLPVTMLPVVGSSRALHEKYYLSLRAVDVLNLSLGFSHAFLRDDLRAELKLLHSRFQQPFWQGLDDYADRGLTGADVSLSYLTILGKLSVGWSFSDLEGYRGISWTELGITL